MERALERLRTYKIVQYIGAPLCQFAVLVNVQVQYLLAFCENIVIRLLQSITHSRGEYDNYFEINGLLFLN